MKDINHYLDVIDIIYWINLDRSKDRRNNMEKILKDIDILNKRINATDANLYEYSDLTNLFINYDIYNRTKIEYAVLHSHLKTIDEFSQSPYKMALIFEDDISLEYVHLWDKKISDIIKGAPKDWDIIMLGRTTKYELYDDYTFNKDGKISSCIAYVINKNAALKLMNQIKNNNKYILYSNKNHTADDYIYSLLKTYVYKYPYFTYPDNNDSTIHQNHLLLHKYSKLLTNKIWKNKANRFNLFNIFLPDIFAFKNILILIVIFIIMYLIILK